MDRLGLPSVDREPRGETVDPSPRRPWHDRLPRPRGRALLATLVLLVGLLALGTWAITRGPDTPALTRADVDSAVRKGVADAQQKARQAPPDAATAYDTARPSLVTVEGRLPDGTSTGAGTVIAQDGSVLTALHVVAGATGVQVTFADGTTSPATVAKQDASADIAVLTPSGLPQVLVPAVLGGGVEVGDAVFALGNPLGLTHSLSAGVVSATGRTVEVDKGRTLKDLIQFDAAVNPGNSGGPLLDRDGQVVGVVTGLANPSRQGFFVGIGFAVPIATAGGAAGAPPQ
ncbi:hypothetical protein GCM10027517_10660 [Phycicoccus ginsengisoli]